MGQPTPARAFRRVAAYALAAVLVIGATAQPAAAEAKSPEERVGAASGSAPATATQGHHGPGKWAPTHDEADAEPSFLQSWWASIYIKLISLRSAIQQALVYAWNLGHSKPDNTCS